MVFRNGAALSKASRRRVGTRVGGQAESPSSSARIWKIILYAGINNGRPLTSKNESTSQAKDHALEDHAFVAEVETSRILNDGSRLTALI